MVTSPDITIECRTPGGIQSARCGGTTQTASTVETRIVPAVA
jgi:hypothetical protein